MKGREISASTQRNISGSSRGDQARGRAIKILVDTAPLVAAIDKRDSAHRAAAHLLASLRRSAIIPTPVLAEVDHLVTSRVGGGAAQAFLREAVSGVHEIAYLSAGLLRRAVELNDRYADLKLGFVDTCVMAIAERHELPILTFDFVDFRATESAAGPWRLALDEQTYMRATRQ